MGDGDGDGDGVGDADPLPEPAPTFFLSPEPVPAFLFPGVDLDGRGEVGGEGEGDADPLPEPAPALFFSDADLTAEDTGEGVGDSVGRWSLVAFFFCFAPCAAVRAVAEVAVRLVVSSGSLTSDAVVSSSFSVSRFMAGWL